MTQSIDKSSLSDAELHRYARQLILPKMDEDHQLKLRQAHALVIGAGGLGAPVLQYLAAAGVGEISVVDDDVIDLTNLNRQVIHDEANIGQAKSISATAAINQINSTIITHSHQAKFGPHNARDLLQNVSILIDASDNPETRLAANFAAHTHGLPLVFGGAVRMEGQVASFLSGVDPIAPCYQCLFPEAAGPALAPGCSEAGILGPITGIIGTMMALESLKQILGSDDVLGTRLDGKLMLYDGYHLTANLITVPKQPNCPTCGG